MTYRTTAEVAELFRVRPRKVWQLAAEHGIGLRIGGSVGWRFSDEDVTAMADALRPAQPAPRRRRRSHSATTASERASGLELAAGSSP